MAARAGFERRSKHMLAARRVGAANVTARLDKKKCSFLKKRTKKLLPIAYAAGVCATASRKSFASFLQKRRPFFFVVPGAPYWESGGGI
jgi:hypothetical protein